MRFVAGDAGVSSLEPRGRAGQGLNVHRLLLARHQSENAGGHCPHADLADARAQHVNHALVRDADHRFAVDFDDPVTHAHSAALRDAAAQERTDDAVLQRKAELVLEIRPLDADLHHGTARHERQLHRAALATHLKSNNAQLTTDN